ncbi:hypothetical protein [Streptomyces sp. NPDC001020]
MADGRPLHGLLLNVTGWRPEEVDDDVALSTELSRGLAASALYGPHPGDRRRSDWTSCSA